MQMSMLTPDVDGNTEAEAGSGTVSDEYPDADADIDGKACADEEIDVDFISELNADDCDDDDGCDGCENDDSDPPYGAHRL